MCGHPDPFRSVRDLGRILVGCCNSRTYPQLAQIVRELCAVAGRWCLPLVAAVAVTVAVSSGQDALARLPPGVRLVTARTVEGMAPYPGQARCLALGFWPECFRRLNVQGGRRPFPEETRSALDIEGKHVTIQGPSPDLSPAMPFAPSTGCQDLQIRRSGHTVQDRPSWSVRWADIPGLSVRVSGCPVAWQQCWQQSPGPSSPSCGPCRCPFPGSVVVDQVVTVKPGASCRR